MNGIIITSENRSDLKLFLKLAKRIGAKTKTLSDEELLDLGLLKMMEEERSSKLESRESVMKKLQDN